MGFAQPPNPFFHRVQIVAERSSLAHFSLDDMHATRLPLLILIATFVFAFQLEGADTAIVSVGGTSIVLPIPEGFFRYDGKSTKVDRLHSVYSCPFVVEITVRSNPWLRIPPKTFRKGLTFDPKFLNLGADKTDQGKVPARWGSKKQQVI